MKRPGNLSWAADHARGYPTYDLNPLLGRYIPSTERDGWGNDFVVDRYIAPDIERAAALVRAGTLAKAFRAIPGLPALSTTSEVQ